MKELVVIHNISKEKLEKLFTILSDPTNTSTDEEICKEVDLSPGSLNSIKKDSEFYVPVIQRFMENVIQLEPTLIKYMFSSARVDGKVAKDLFGIIKEIKQDRTSTQSDGLGVFSDLSDADLEAEICRLLELTQPQDVIYEELETAPDVQRKLEDFRKEDGYSTRAKRVARKPAKGKAKKTRKK